ncbi:hypothetical protein NM688_g4385 [Phlebia brevispora]|uniref:Uncharacterized protein n=1 Tax=Phlebia brevispora TaxID=194682 RepID=A0ACC1T379_9APHY|nr:hypothetical protein NM688_g4385 [Phlebia brevispora]
MSTKSIADTFINLTTYDTLCFSALALACYEYFLTLEHEWDFLWNRKWTVATWLFLANRYVMLAEVALVNAPFTSQVMWLWLQSYFFHVHNIASQTCNDIMLTNFCSLILMVPLFLTAAFSAIRVFALSRRLWVSGLTLLWGLVPIAGNIYLNFHSIHTFSQSVVTGASCDISQVNISPRMYFGEPDSSSAPTIADAIVLAITWHATFQNFREASSLRMSVGVSEILLRDGSTSFIVLLALNIIQLITYVDPQLAAYDGPTPLIFILQPILISRFLINLRQLDAPTRSSSESRHFSRFSIPNFRIPTIESVVGNMGEPLDYGANDHSDEEDMKAVVEGGNSHNHNLATTSRQSEHAGSIYKGFHKVAFEELV